MSRLVLFLFLMVVCACFGVEGELRKVKVVSAEFPPLIFTTDEGVVSGIIPKILNEIAKEQQWTIIWQLDDWSNQLDRIKRGEADLVAAIGFTPEREEFLDFSKESILSVWGQLYTSSSTPIDNFLELNNKKIAVLKNGISGERFSVLCQQFGIRCLIYEMPIFEDVFKAVHEGKVDAGVVNNLYGFANEVHFNLRRSDIMFNPFPVLFAVPKYANQDLLKTIDESLLVYKSNQQSIYYSLTQDWLARKTVETFPAWILISIISLLMGILFLLVMAFLLKRKVILRTHLLTQSEAQLRQLINLVPHMIFATDAKGQFVLVNKATTEFFGTSASELKEMTRAELLGKKPFLEKLLVEDERFMGQKKGLVQQDVEIWKDDKEHFYFQMSKVPFLRKQTTIPAVVSVAVDVTEQTYVNEKIKHLACHDELTGLPNRSLLTSRLQDALVIAKKYQRIGAVIFIDLDLFKNVNDTLGHAVGDIILQVTAARIKKTCSEKDTVARLSGDEYAIVIAELDDAFELAIDEVIDYAKRIRNEVVKEVLIGKHSVSVSISQGIVLFPDDADKEDIVMQRADTAMHHAKSLGRNKIVMFHKSMEKVVKRKEKLKSELRSALKNNELFVVYQPQYDMKTKSLMGFEALCRWQHSKEHLIYPVEFIPIAEESGLIREIGYFVLSKACEQLAQWNQAYSTSYYVTVNLSFGQLETQQLKAEVVDVLNSSKLDPSLLELEVTESIIMTDMEHSLSTLSYLRRLGIKISLDDFGTGYSSLAYLKKLPLDKLKIDKSFVQDIPNDKDSEAIVRTIVSMAKELGMEVVAEGVEHIEQIEFLMAHDCHLFQGYYFSPPKPAPDVARLFLKVVNGQ